MCFSDFFSPFDVLSSAGSVVLGKGQRCQIRVSRQSPKNLQKSPNWHVQSVFLAFFFLRVGSIANKVELDIGTTFFSYWYHMGYIGTLSSICSLLFWNVLSLFRLYEILIVFSLEFVAYILMNDDYFSKILIFDALIIDASKAHSDKSCFTIKQPTCNKILAKNFLLSSFLFFPFFPGDATMVRHAVAYSLFRSAH